MRVILKLFLLLHSQAGSPWFSILTRTGLFRQKENHAEYPAHLVSLIMLHMFPIVNLLFDSVSHFYDHIL